MNADFDILEAMDKNFTDGAVAIPKGPILIDDLKVPEAIKTLLRRWYEDPSPTRRLTACVLNTVIASGSPVFAITRSSLFHWTKEDPNGKGPATTSLYSKVRKDLRVCSEVLADKGNGRQVTVFCLKNVKPFSEIFDWSKADDAKKRALAFRNHESVEEALVAEVETPNQSKMLAESKVPPVVKKAPKSSKKSRAAEEDDEADPGPVDDEPDYVDDDPLPVVDEAPRRTKSPAGAFDMKQFFLNHPKYQQFYTNGDESEFRSEAEYLKEMVDRSTPF